MASLNRAEMVTIYEDAKYIYTQSRLPDVRRKAKAIAAAMEQCVGQLGRVPAKEWEI